MLRLYFSLASPLLFLALCKNDRCLASLQKENLRLHSENFLTHLKEILKQVNHSLAELDEIYFTSWPSGQTGLRVSLTFLATLQVLNPKIKFYHINTLLLQAGNDKCLGLLTIDSRASKYYLAVYQQKRCLLTTQIINKEELISLMKRFSNFLVRKDFSETGLTENPREFNKHSVDFLSHFQALKNEFVRLRKIEEIDF
ncbi:MAG: hypothetical protein I3273_00720 [Candidatus Moeniiplasma glomeromycotorum]|nr:hypothetical protein [Candidatus Moeniiplasma glomeromycotorum]MCE8167354.1 hypothetical protein [Candidatus Moeniiplasma glomeromycotorum]MCE8168633.1 hypothetical protein [Candidatus Moeniiplasma glomeromycotorum]